MKKKFIALIALTVSLSACKIEVYTPSNENSSEESFVSETSQQSDESTESIESIQGSEDSKSEESSESQQQSETEPSTDPIERIDNYYSTLTSWENGEDLKNKLHTIIRNGYHALPYNWDSNSCADQSLTDFETVDVVYSDVDLLKTSTDAKFYGWQREHAYAASLMTCLTTSDAVKAPGRSTDFHNLFASYGNANGARGNKNLGIADKTDSSYIGPGNDANGISNTSSDKVNFEPADEDKGRLSRAIFYMVTMYNEQEKVTVSSTEYTYEALKVVEEPVLYDKTNPQYSIGNLSTLLNWSDSCNVDRLEFQHNESVYFHKVGDYAQGNRNPYVDYPELVDYAFGSKKNQSGKLSDLTASYKALRITEDEVANYAIKNAKRNYFVGDEFTSDDISFVKVKNDFTYENVNSIEVTPYTFTETDATNQIKTLNFNTPMNNLKFIAYVKHGGLESCSYQYTFTGSAAGTPLNPIKNKAATDNELTLDGVAWIIRWDEGAIGTGSAENGTKFGNGTTPVKNLSFITKESVTIDKAYISLNAASKQTYKLTIKVGDETIVNNMTINYNSAGPLAYGVSLETSKTGRLSFLLSEVTSGAATVQTLAMNVVNA